MSITRFRPEIWSAKLLVAARKKLVYGGPDVVNRDYEGEIQQAGDTVRITSIGRPTVSDYTPNSTVISPQELTDAQRTLVVDQAKYFAFKVDDVDKRQAQGNVLSAGMDEAAYALADVMDRYIASLYTGVASSNFLNSGSAISVTESNYAYFYDKIVVPLGVALDEANVPSEGRYLIAPPWLIGRGRRDDRLLRVDASGSDATLRNGLIARAGGFDIRVSNNTPNPSGNDNVVTAGVQSAITFAEQINKTEAYRPESSSDAVKGLALYGAKLVDPSLIAAAVVSPD